jgi:hypothetical protein
MSKNTYQIILYSFVSILILSFLLVAYYAYKSNDKYKKLIAITHDGKINYSEIISSDSVNFYQNISEEISKIETDSVKILSFFKTDSSEINYEELLKFIFNSFKHLRVAVNVNEIKPNYSDRIELELLVKNFDDLLVKIIFIKEGDKYKIIDIINLANYLKCLEIIFDYHGFPNSTDLSEHYNGLNIKETNT